MTPARVIESAIGDDTKLSGQVLETRAQLFGMSKEELRAVRSEEAVPQPPVAPAAPRPPMPPVPPVPQGGGPAARPRRLAGPRPSRTRTDEESVLRRVDALIDLLDRVPGARPRHPATVV